MAGTNSLPSLHWKRDPHQPISSSIKKPNHLIPRQLGYLWRPVAFRPCLSAGLALSYINFILYLLYVKRLLRIKGTMWYWQRNKWQKVKLEMFCTSLQIWIAHSNETLPQSLFFWNGSVGNDSEKKGNQLETTDSLLTSIFYSWFPSL